MAFGGERWLAVPRRSGPAQGETDHTIVSSLSGFLRKQRMRWYADKIPRVHQLRRRLAYYVAKHGFEIGDYSFGDPDIRYFDDGGRLRVGKYCSVARGATLILGGNHRTATISTYPMGLATRDVGADDLPRSRGDIVIGSDVWIAANAIVLSGVTIGDGAVIGAGAVVVDDIPAYAVAVGNPAHVTSKRFPDHITSELLELRWWDLDFEQVQSLRPLLQSTDVAAFIEACRICRGLSTTDGMHKQPTDAEPGGRQ